MTSIEDLLRDAMTAKAETVRDDGRPRALATPLPRRAFGSRWWAPIAVAIAIVVVVAGTVLATRAVAPPAPAVRPSPSVPFLEPIAPPIKEVWPGAVHEIPSTGPGGRVFKPDVFVSDRVVVGRGLTKNRLDGIWAYDIDKRAFSRIAHLKDRRVMDDAVDFGGGFVAWHAWRNGMTEIWAVPVTGGAPRLIASVAGVTTGSRYDGIDLAIADGMAVWSPPTGGVYSAPLTGGAAALIKGTKGYHLLEWPWARRPGDDPTGAHPVKAPIDLIDLRTGTDVVDPEGRGDWDDCGVTWCMNSREAWRRDGTSEHALPGIAAWGSGLHSDRFVLLHQEGPDGRQAIAVHDVATRRTGRLGLAPMGKGDEALPTPHSGSGLVWHNHGDTQVVVNLTEIT